MLEGFFYIIFDFFFFFFIFIVNRVAILRAERTEKSEANRERGCGDG